MENLNVLYQNINRLTRIKYSEVNGVSIKLEHRSNPFNPIGKYDYKIVVFEVDINDETPFSKTLLQEISNHIGIIVKMLLSECDFIRVYFNGILQCNPSY
jgi:hypothetical protein